MCAEALPRVSFLEKGAVKTGFLATIWLRFRPLDGSSQATLPEPRGFINDFAGVLTAAQSSELGQVAASLQQQNGAQLAVAIVDSVAPLDPSLQAAVAQQVRQPAQREEPSLWQCRRGGDASGSPGAGRLARDQAANRRAGRADPPERIPHDAQLLAQVGADLEPDGRSALPRYVLRAFRTSFSSQGEQASTEPGELQISHMHGHMCRDSLIESGSCPTWSHDVH